MARTRVKGKLPSKLSKMAESARHPLSQAAGGAAVGSVFGPVGAVLGAGIAAGTGAAWNKYKRGNVAGKGAKGRWVTSRGKHIFISEGVKK